MKNTDNYIACITLSDLSEGQIRFLSGHSYAKEWRHCSCGACDPEEVMKREFASLSEAEAFESSVVYDAAGEVKDAVR
jgi:hypothetical protein